MAYQMTISANGVTSINMNNFANLDITVKADLLDKNNLIIPPQTEDGFTVGGTGVINRYRTMELSFHYRHGGELVEITADCTKQ